MTQAPPAKGRTGRLWLTMLLLALLLLGGASWVFRRAVYQAPLAPQAGLQPPLALPPAPADAPVEEAVVVTAQGPVQRAVAGGDWLRVVPGDRLRADDALRTGKGGSAGLRVGEKSQLSVAEGSQLTVRELTRAVHRFKLDRGRIGVDYQADGKRVLRIENETSGGAAETTAARFSVLSSGATVAVATETGTVDLTGASKRVQVTAGSQAVVALGQAPSAPEQIPVKLLLKVAGAAGLPGSSLCARVEGVVQPGAELLIDGVAAPVDRAGRFSVPVPRQPKDKAQVLVAMRDALGREQRRTVPCVGETPESAIKDFALRWRRKASP